MKILKSNLERSEIGFFQKTDSVFIFFGNRCSSLSSIQTAFPNLEVQRIKQTHSDIVVAASDQIAEADSHFSSLAQKALIISTADCLPVLIHCSQTKRIAAIHAGWKGVVNQIVLKTLKKLIETGSSNMQFQIWIGPHILQSSFEIDLDVMKQLESSAFSLPEEKYAYQKDSKYYADLNQIVFSQIAHVTKPAKENVSIHCLEIDTKTDAAFWSFRRDKEKAGRNLSFIALS